MPLNGDLVQTLEKTISSVQQQVHILDTICQALNHEKCLYHKDAIKENFVNEEFICWFSNFDLSYLTVASLQITT